MRKVDKHVQKKTKKTKVHIHTQYSTVHAAEPVHYHLRVVHAIQPVVQLSFFFFLFFFCSVSLQRINHAAKPVQCGTLCILVQAGTHRGLAGGGKKLLLAGSSQQGSTPGKGVRGGLRWETNDIGPGSSFDMTEKCEKTA